MKLVNNYLTAEQVGAIAIEMSNTKDILAREILRGGLVAQALVDFEGADKDFTTCDEYYDTIMASDIDIEKEVKNIASVDRVVNGMVGFESTLTKFIEEVSKTAEKSMKKIPKELKGVKVEDLFNQFKEVLNNGNKDNNIN